MSGRTVVLRGAGMLSTADLSCQVREENKARRECYRAEWRDLSLSSRAEKSCSMRESDDHRKETHTKCREVQFLVQRSPWNIMNLVVSLRCRLSTTYPTSGPCPCRSSSL
ncbi:hypothetical protein NDU88_001707 [Pleurodeles waltl]|uniref:Uncharacterized protein n=2 Tax=Pleurodeles waltl TaxID=8319 RepID=A0AAV7Q7M6_PLEWA|nr:hypothetical protein NDU88_001707 [Pleurodeles waltl]